MVLEHFTFRRVHEAQANLLRGLVAILMADWKTFDNLGFRVTSAVCFRRDSSDAKVHNGTNSIGRPASSSQEILVLLLRAGVR